MPDTIRIFLAGTQYANWQQDHLAGDASARRYIRLHNDGETAILMDAPTDGSTQAFENIATWLRANNLGAPKILKHDASQGLMLLEDLGTSHLTEWLTTHPTDEAQLYQAATDVLIALDGLPAPQNLSVLTPTVGGEMLEITCEWYADGVSPETLTREMQHALSAHCSAPTVVALRDYHAENLIWRPDRSGTGQIGLLDFQDAVIAPRGYDLVSLIRDARRRIDTERATQLITQFANAVSKTPMAISPALATLAVQRNLRILGVFARLARQNGKARYMAFMPRLWDMICEDLNHPSLTQFQTTVFATLPPPEHSAIKDLL